MISNRGLSVRVGSAVCYSGLFLSPEQQPKEISNYSPFLRVKLGIMVSSFGLCISVHSLQKVAQQNSLTQPHEKAVTSLGLYETANMIHSFLALLFSLRQGLSGWNEFQGKVAL